MLAVGTRTFPSTRTLLMQGSANPAVAQEKIRTALPASRLIAEIHIRTDRWAGRNKRFMQVPGGFILRRSQDGSFLGFARNRFTFCCRPPAPLARRERR